MVQDAPEHLSEVLHLLCQLSIVERAGQGGHGLVARSQISTGLCMVLDRSMDCHKSLQVSRARQWLRRLLLIASRGW